MSGSTRGRVEGTGPVAVDVFLRSDGAELGRDRTRSGFWLRTPSDRLWVEAAGADVQAPARTVARGPWSQVAARPEAAGLAQIAIGPHVQVELVTRAVTGGDEVAVEGRITARAAQAAGDYREAAGERVLVATSIVVGALERAAPTGAERRGKAAEIALALGAAAALAGMGSRLWPSAAVELWAWSGWWAVLWVGAVAIAARRTGFPHLFPDRLWWAFVPQFVEVHAEPRRADDERSRGLWLGAFAVIGNLATTAPYLLVWGFSGDPSDDGLLVLCAAGGAVNHAVAWAWLLGRLGRAKADVRRLQALLGASSPAWTVREGDGDAPLDRQVDVTVEVRGAGRQTHTEHRMAQRWSATAMTLRGPDGAWELSLPGALVASDGERVLHRTKPKTTERWCFSATPRWRVGHAGPPQPSVAARGPESVLVLAIGDDPVGRARRALWQRMLAVAALALVTAGGAFATGVYAALSALTY